MRRVLGIALVGALALATLTGCIDGKVKKRKGCTGSGEARVCRLLVVSNDGKERIAEVDQAAYDECGIGDSYPSCGSTGYDNPEGRQKQNQEKTKEKRRCDRKVQLVASWEPAMFVMVDWFVEDRNGRRGQVQAIHRGAFGHTEHGVCPGGLAGIRADGKAGDPDLCIVIVRVNGVDVSNKPPARHGSHCGTTASIP